MLPTLRRSCTSPRPEIRCALRSPSIGRPLEPLTLQEGAEPLLAALTVLHAVVGASPVATPIARVEVGLAMCELARVTAEAISDLGTASAGMPWVLTAITARRDRLLRRRAKLLRPAPADVAEAVPPRPPPSSPHPPNQAAARRMPACFPHTAWQVAQCNAEVRRVSLVGGYRGLEV